MFQKIASCFLALCLLFGLLPALTFQTSAALSGTCGDHLTWTFDYETGVLTISGTGAMKYYKDADDVPWDNRRSDITSVRIKEGVTTVGTYAFHECTNLTNLELPSSLEFIHKNAFYSCKSLTSVKIPYGVERIGASAFRGCRNLKSIALPDSVTAISEYAFTACSSLTSITLPDSITNIANNTFAACRGLTSVTLPQSLTNIDSHAFADCESLTSVVIPGNVTTICSFAFSSCTSLTSLFLPKSLATVENFAFSSCSALSDVYYSGTEEMWNKIFIQLYNNELWSARIHFNSGVPETPFSDVKYSDYFFTPVLWAVENHITNGISATEFAPNANCSRGQIVTFLWRACGSPEPTKADNPFTDVSPSEYYYKAVLWAIENGITTGMSANTFEPNATCTRGQVATFLWRSQGKPAPKSDSSSFVDVKSGEYYYSAVLWAVENSITNGTDVNTFSPDASCTRGQIVTFLYRTLA